jgi:hypothetical protein
VKLHPRFAIHGRLTYGARIVNEPPRFRDIATIQRQTGGRAEYAIARTADYACVNVMQRIRCKSQPLSKAVIGGVFIATLARDKASGSDAGRLLQEKLDLRTCRRYRRTERF